MRLQELFETTEEDRALISLSSAIYNTIRTKDGDLGTIGELYNTSIPALSKVKIAVESGDQFAEHVKDPNDPMDYSGLEVYAFWDEDTHSIVFNKDLINTERMKTTVTHELRHALDELKSNSYPGGATRYFTPKKKEHRKDDPYSTTQYRARPAEINARFTEILHKLSDLVPKRYAAVEPHLLRRQLMHDFNNLLVKYEIADLFPEKTQSKDYKRLVKRAYDFIQKEMSHIESQPGTTKRASGNW